MLQAAVAADEDLCWRDCRPKSWAVIDRVVWVSATRRRELDKQPAASSAVSRREECKNEKPFQRFKIVRGGQTGMSVLPVGFRILQLNHQSHESHGLSSTGSHGGLQPDGEGSTNSPRLQPWVEESNARMRNRFNGFRSFSVGVTNKKANVIASPLLAKQSLICRAL